MTGNKKTVKENEQIEIKTFEQMKFRWKWKFEHEAI